MESNNNKKKKDVLNSPLKKENPRLLESLFQATANVTSFSEVKLSGCSSPFDELFVLLQLIGTAVWKFRFGEEERR